MNLVLCEGKEDKLVMEALAAHLGIASGLIFKSYDSAERLRSNLLNLRSQGRFASGELRNVLVTRAADVHQKEVFAYWTICAQGRDPGSGSRWNVPCPISRSIGIIRLSRFSVEFFGKRQLGRESREGWRWPQKRLRSLLPQGAAERVRRCP